MTVRVLTAPFGRPAAAKLRAEISVAQESDPLTPVSVIVPRGAVALATRRLLASGDVGCALSGRPGLVNVRFITAATLADEIAGARLAASGRLPATGAVVDAAVRAALARHSGGLLGPARDHPATVDALAGAYRDLRGVSGAALARLGSQSPRAAEVLGLLEAVAARLVDWYDEVDLVDAATGIVADQDGWPGLRVHHLWYLPLSPTPPVERLVGALGRHGTLAVLIGVTGDESADASARSLGARMAGGGAPGPPDSGAPVPLATAVLNAPSADAEVLETVRGLMERNANGVALERMAIAYAGPPPYPRLVREFLGRAGIAFHGGGSPPLSATVAGRTLLGTFELADHDWARDDVASWLAGAPILSRGRPVPASEWDIISRRAGVLGGGDWAAHLAGFNVQLGQRLAEELGDIDDDAVESADARRWRRQLAQGEELATFVAELMERLGDAQRPWAQWVAWSKRLMEDYLGGPGYQAEWPGAEVEALTAVREALDGLTVLDRVAPGVDRATFRAALTSELGVPAPQTARFGHGVLVGRVGELAGLDLDVVFVLGMNDGAFPSAQREDALLPDRERSAGGPEVPLRAVRVDDARRDYLAALQAASERVLSFARGGATAGRELRPSRWLLDSVGTLTDTGRRLYSGDLASVAPSGSYRVVPSFAAAVGAAGEPASPADRDLRSLLGWHEATGGIGGHYLVALDPVLGAGVRTRRGRRSVDFTRFDGNLSGVENGVSVGDRLQSATGLESYAACPRKYLFDRVLRIGVDERPEEILRLSPRDRGLVVHEVLETFVGDQTSLDPDRRLVPGAPWGEAGHARMDEVAAAVFERFEQAGLVGRPLLWGYDRNRIRRDLHRFIDEDDTYRREFGVVPEVVEFAFGRADGPPLDLALSGGRHVTFSGRVDRVDRSTDGSLVVIDYKTGKVWGVDELQEDAVIRGTKLQLIVYGLAARERFGADAVQSFYWYVSTKGDFERRGYLVDDGRRRRFEAALEVVVDGIESGHFPARPGPALKNVGVNCQFCDFKAACPGDRARAWERLSHAPELSGYVALADPDPVAP